MTKRLLRGTELRYVLTDHLQVHGEATVTDLIETVERWGFVTDGRPSKAISDALRWEMRLGRVAKRRRGLYVPGWMPRGTEHRIHTRVLALREEAHELSSQGSRDDVFPDPARPLRYRADRVARS